MYLGENSSTFGDQMLKVLGKLPRDVTVAVSGGPDLHGYFRLSF